MKTLDELAATLAAFTGRKTEPAPSIKTSAAPVATAPETPAPGAETAPTASEVYPPRHLPLIRELASSLGSVSLSEMLKEFGNIEMRSARAAGHLREMDHGDGSIFISLSASGRAAVKTFESVEVKYGIKPAFYEIPFTGSSAPETPAPMPKAPAPSPDPETPAPMPKAPAPSPDPETPQESPAPRFNEEMLASSKTVTRRNQGGGVTGLQFIPTPDHAAKFIAQVLQAATFFTFDPSAGSGDLLKPFSAWRRVGAELDPQRIKESQDKEREYKALEGDIQALYPLLRLSPLRFSRIVCNPPFGLDWQQGSVNHGQPASSTRISFEMCLGLLRGGGQGAFICGTRRLDEEILTVPALAKAVHTILDVPGLFPGVDLDCSIVFFADPVYRKAGREISRETCAPGPNGTPAYPSHVAVRTQAANTFRYLDASEALQTNAVDDALRQIQAEHKRRIKQSARESGYDIELSGSKIRVYLSALAVDGLIRAGNAYHDNGTQTLSAVRALAGQQANYFAVNGREWKWVSRIIADGLLTMHPEDREKLAAIVEEGRRAACPMYALKPQQRLGYIEDLDNLPCILSDEAKGFEAGQSYPVTVGSEIQSDAREEVKIDDDGDPHSHTFVTERKVLRVCVTNAAGGEVILRENKEDLEYLLAHFDVPDPGDLSTQFPEQMEDCRNVLRRIEAEILAPRGFRLKDYQREDVCRLALKGGGVLAWEQGLGKTLGAMMYALFCEYRHETDGNALFIAPQDLIPQWAREAEKFTGRTMEHITTQAQAHRISKEILRGERAPAWYITHYEALALAGTQAPEIKGTRKGDRGERILPVQTVTERAEMQPVPGYWDDQDNWVPSTTVMVKVPLTTKDLCPQCWNKGVQTDTGLGWNGLYCPVCGYTHKALSLPSIGHELRKTFYRGVVLVDEGTKIKGDSLQSLAVRGLRAARKLLLTGTPQKNYVNDMFWLLGWACRFSSARFPFAYDGGKTKFEKDYCVIEYKEGDKGRRKILPEVTNLSMLWRLLSGNIVRRRKEQSGETLVPRTFVPVTVPFGEAQKSLYGKWLHGFAAWYRATHPNAGGNVERFAACLGQLPKLNWTSTLPAADADAPYWAVPGVSNWTPKMLKVLELAAQHAAAGEKVLIGSDVMLTGRMLAGALNDKGIPAGHILEGEGSATKTKAPKARAGAIHDFQNGETRVLCAGVQSINLGHNLDAATVVILAGLPWDFATLHQFLARVHRLTSTRPVTVYVVMTAGSLDERKWQLLTDKGLSADLALDGELSDVVQKPLNMQEILMDLIKRGLPVDEENSVVPEDECRRLWEGQAFELKPLLGPLAPEAAPEPEALAEAPTEAAGEPEQAMQETEQEEAEQEEADAFMLQLVTAGPVNRFDTKKGKPEPVKTTEINTGLFAGFE